MMEVMIEELLNQVELGKRADSGFKKEAWVAVCAMVQTVNIQPLIELQCKAKIETLKDLWKGLNWLLDQSGFGYDEAKLVTAPDNVWADLRKVLSLEY
jgi:Myb/SANT-like DNA-binding domain